MKRLEPSGFVNKCFDQCAGMGLLLLLLLLALLLQKELVAEVGNQRGWKIPVREITLYLMLLVILPWNIVTNTIIYFKYLE